MYSIHNKFHIFSCLSPTQYDPLELQGKLVNLRYGALTWHWCWHGKVSLHLAAHGLCPLVSAHEPHFPVHRWPHFSAAAHFIGHGCVSRSQHLATNRCFCSRGHVSCTGRVHFLYFASVCWLQTTSCSCVSSSHRRTLTYITNTSHSFDTIPTAECSPFLHLSHPKPNPNSYPNLTLTLNLTLT